MHRLLLIAVLTSLIPAVQAAGDKITVSHAIAMHGDLKYGPDFKHFDYVNPSAPKGGEAKLYAIGTYDSLNPFILKGVTPAGNGLLFATLAVKSDDEPFSMYGYVAESIEMPADRSWVAYTLRPQARFQDGSPITADDVIFSFEALKTKGHPFYRMYYASVAKAEKLGERKVKFTFTPGDNRELPLIVGEMPVLSKSYYSKQEFEKTTLTPPLGSGPYRVATLDPGRSIVYARVKDWWGADLPVNVGRFNFDRIRYDYYRDATVALEAFKAGQYDFREENIAKNWAIAYSFPAMSQGLVKKEEIPHQIPEGMQCFVYNTRRPVFQDPRVRDALAYAFDFEWTNKNLFYGAYTRNKSYFSNSELASSGLPDPEELKILEPFRGKIPEQVFTQEYQPPKTDSSGNIRGNLHKAVELLKQAGWTVKGERLVDASGRPMEFEILLVDPSFERVVLPFVRNLERLGVKANVRTIDTTQYQNRMDSFDFDMTVHTFPQSLSPGNEQRDFWTSKVADTTGSRNVAGVKSPVVDSLVDLVISAPDRQSLVYRTHALDRVLLWGFYAIPQWHLSTFRVAYWDKFGRPAKPPKYALGFEDWWADPAKAAALIKVRGTR